VRPNAVNQDKEFTQHRRTFRPPFTTAYRAPSMEHLISRFLNIPQIKWIRLANATSPGAVGCYIVGRCTTRPLSTTTRHHRIPERSLFWPARDDLSTIPRRRGTSPRGHVAAKHPQAHTRTPSTPIAGFQNNGRAEIFDPASWLRMMDLVLRQRQVLSWSSLPRGCRSPPCRAYRRRGTPASPVLTGIILSVDFQRQKVGVLGQSAQ